MNGYLKTEAGATRRSNLDAPAVLHGGHRIPSPQLELQCLSRRCLQGLFAYLLVSTCFFWIRRLDLLAPLAESTREFLGCPPPPALTTLALSGYLVSALVLILARTARGARPLLKWQHLVYRTVFFPFYGVANALDEHFLAVFVAGLVMFGLELLNIWAYSLKLLPPGKEMAVKL